MENVKNLTVYAKTLFHFVKGNGRIIGQDGKHSNHGLKHPFSYQENQQRSSNDDLNSICFPMSSCMPNPFKCEGQNNEITFIQYFEMKFSTRVCPPGIDP